MSPPRRPPSLARRVAAWRGRRRDSHVGAPGAETAAASTASGGPEGTDAPDAPDAPASPQARPPAQRPPGERTYHHEDASTFADVAVGWPFPWSMAEDWSLVLAAKDIPCAVVRVGGGYRVMVPLGRMHEARVELAAFQAENPHKGPLGAAMATLPNRLTVILGLMLLLVGFVISRHSLAVLGVPPTTLEELGRLEGGRVLAGEWWRPATALTLHADEAHVLGNVVVGALFVVPLAGRYGAGAAFLLTLASGILGNACNALVQRPDHLSIGFSTAVFGAAAALATLTSVEGRHHRWHTPVVAGLGLLALMGVGGEHTDVGAHLFGFLSGLALGAPAALLLWRFGHPPAALRLLLGLVAALLLPAAWAWALWRG